MRNNTINWTEQSHINITAEAHACWSSGFAALVMDAQELQQPSSMLVMDAQELLQPSSIYCCSTRTYRVRGILTFLLFCSSQLRLALVYMCELADGRVTPSMSLDREQIIVFPYLLRVGPA